MSMLRARFLLLGALAVLATSALAAASTLGAPPASRTAGRAVPAAGIPLALTSAAPVTADQSLYLPLIAAPRAHGPTRVTTTTITIPTHVYEPALSSVYVPA